LIFDVPLHSMKGSLKKSKFPRDFRTIVAIFETDIHRKVESDRIWSLTVVIL